MIRIQAERIFDRLRELKRAISRDVKGSGQLGLFEDIVVEDQHATKESTEKREQSDEE